MIIERWAFSRDELAHPDECSSHDELIAYVDVDNDFGGTDGYGIIVYRNGKISNRFDDGTAGVPKRLADLAFECEYLIHPNDGETYLWHDVVVDPTNGSFVRFPHNRSPL
jgi:hypothetical protein